MNKLLNNALLRGDPLPSDGRGDRWPHVPSVKAPHRDTAVRAAKQVTLKHGSLKARCFALISERGNLTADEAADILGESVLNVRPAMSALVKLALIVDGGDRRNNASGNPMIAWRPITANDVAKMATDGGGQ